jgi:hypothetical protein
MLYMTFLLYSVNCWTVEVRKSRMEAFSPSTQLLARILNRDLVICCELEALERCQSLRLINNNPVAWVREWTIPTERPPLVGEVSANFCEYKVPRDQRDRSLRPYSRLSRPETLRLCPINIRKPNWNLCWCKSLSEIHNLYILLRIIVLPPV